MWKWDQSAGVLTRNGESVTGGNGYSGAGRGKNNPAMQAARGVGPVPRGIWVIGAPYQSKNTGPFTMPLTARDEKPKDDIHQPTGRSAFRIHGDSIKNPGTASHGCIILPRFVREKIWKSGDREIEVVE